MLKIGTSTGYFRERYGDEEALVRLKDCGFDAVDFGLLHLTKDSFPADLPPARFDRYFEKLGDRARAIGLEVYQTHSPYPFCYPDGRDEELGRFFLQERAIRAASRLGAKYAVLHPARSMEIDDSTFPADRDVLLRFADRLLPVLREYDVVACFENIYGVEKGEIYPIRIGQPREIAAVLEELDPDRFAACVDTEHAAITGTDPAEAIRILGPRIRALHLHDGDGVHDEHLAPYLGSFDWTEIARALAEVGFCGALNLEADRTYEWRPLFGEDPMLTARLLAASARKLRDEIEALAKK